MGARCTRMKLKPFARLRKYIQDRKERKREKKLRKERNNLLRQLGELESGVASTGAASPHSNMDSSCHSVHEIESSAGSKDTEEIGTCFMLSRQGKINDGEESDASDDSDDSDGEGIPLGVKTASDNILTNPWPDARDDKEEDMEDIFTSNLRLRKIVSDLSEVHKRSLAVEDMGHRAIHRGTVSLTAAIVMKTLPTIPENDILTNVTRPLPTPPAPQGELQEDFHPPGFVP